MSCCEHCPKQLTPEEAEEEMFFLSLERLRARAIAEQIKAKRPVVNVRVNVNARPITDADSFRRQSGGPFRL